ncbi:RteC domain-containing protein [Elizabethkingia anophelis]|uniref:RteC domain-containing protein n=2 Tax=Bacteroidota TaxID=976 RepID=UPI000B5193A7|nr:MULTISPECIES: RteC domain-containing protein [Weeksellaceae]ASE60524.1 tetracycline regulation of excision, RteC [Chryseobacterium indologenes]MBE9394945.1 RteC domain-containing protein [Elizabethkingia anophelis]MBE9406435.1 RteC domain-containing protein [Elizabethkingia anophelis]
MDKFYNETLAKLENEIKEFEIEADCSIERIEAVIQLIIKCLFDVKKYILKRGFKNVDEEIRFFKYQKPIIVSKLIYYNAIYKIETRRPYGNKRTKKYFVKELKKLKRFFENNLDFYKYYRSNNSFFDEQFFVRGKHDIRLWLDTFYFEADHRFSTSHDYKVAKIIANDLIQVYLEDRLNNINVKKVSDNSLIWTASKTALTELIYALYSHGAFNNGNTEIKLIAKTFEDAFNIELGDFYHTFMELKARKINRTKFLDRLCTCIEKRKRKSICRND